MKHILKITFFSLSAFVLGLFVRESTAFADTPHTSYEGCSVTNTCGTNCNSTGDDGDGTGDGGAGTGE